MGGRRGRWAGAGGGPSPLPPPARQRLPAWAAGPHLAVPVHQRGAGQLKALCRHTHLTVHSHQVVGGGACREGRTNTHVAVQMWRGYAARVAGAGIVHPAQAPAAAAPGPAHAGAPARLLRAGRQPPTLARLRGHVALGAHQLPAGLVQLRRRQGGVAHISAAGGQAAGGPGARLLQARPGLRQAEPALPCTPLTWQHHPGTASTCGSGYPCSCSCSRVST